jgi:8-oxo-dGTP pyrophosphatase MutT (NUDIX family)
LNQSVLYPEVDRIAHSIAMGVDPSPKLPRPPRLSKRRQQVAAVCYRVRKNGIEFLLIQTRGGRWIFPKGGLEPGFTHAQSAALEAFEEAGVHGRMEEIPFARYFRRKPDSAPSAEERQVSDPSSQSDLPVAAHLCEVSRLERPQESNRKPTWFSPEKAKRCLLADRPAEFGAELARVVDRALLRIHRLRNGVRNTQDHPHRDSLREARFEPLSETHSNGANPDAAVARQLRKIFQMQIGAPREIRRSVLRLGTGTRFATDTVQNVTAIDSKRGTNPSKPRSKRTAQTNL